MKNGKPITDNEILATLSNGGHSISDYVLSPDGKVPLLGNARSGWSALLIENDLLGEACVKYLSRLGIRRITLEELKKPSNAK